MLSPCNLQTQDIENNKSTEILRPLHLRLREYHKRGEKTVRARRARSCKRKDIRRTWNQGLNPGGESGRSGGEFHGDTVYDILGELIF